jgi:hypothetical protein
LPVIFVHGLLTSAGSTQPVAALFQSLGGYSDEELYATTYGPRGALIWNAAIECLYAQAVGLKDALIMSQRIPFLLQFRYLIIAVSEYTNNQVCLVKAKEVGKFSH